MNLPTISKTKMKKAWRAKLNRTEQELRVERVEQMLDMMLVEKICKAGAVKQEIVLPASMRQTITGDSECYFTPEGGQEIYLGKATITIEESK